jgi:hypothetical protein
VRGVLAPVYAALGLEWDPSTTGEVAAEAPGSGWEQLRDALLAEYARDHDLVPVGVDEQTLELALDLVAEHRAAVHLPE